MKVCNLLKLTILVFSFFLISVLTLNLRGRLVQTLIMGRRSRRQRQTMLSTEQLVTLYTQAKIL